MGDQHAEPTSGRLLARHCSYRPGNGNYIGRVRSLRGLGLCLRQHGFPAVVACKCWAHLSILRFDDPRNVNWLIDGLSHLAIPTAITAGDAGLPFRLSGIG